MTRRSAPNQQSEPARPEPGGSGGADRPGDAGTPPGGTADGEGRFATASPSQPDAGHGSPNGAREPAQPNFSEELAQQLGGVRGLTESSIPVAVFVVVNVIWSLNPALVASLVVAGGIVLFRAFRRQPVRHAVNGVVGIGIGAAIAWKTGEAKDYYLPGIVVSFAYGGLLVLSAVTRHPVIGYLWAVIAAGGKQVWRQRPRLLRTFQWLTLLWAATFLVKGVVWGWLYTADMETWLGIARIGLSYPLYLTMLGVTVWAVRRVTHADPVDG